MATTTRLRPDLGRQLLDRSGLDVDYLLDVEWVCNGFRVSQGEEPREHADPNDYTLDDILDMHRYAVCPLHINPSRPGVPEGVWKRDAARSAEGTA